ncbi:MAG TPA: hypothetical protein VJL58_00305 [Pyrinomonadaceae bacterium]|nr:hypothetical protein [Pyrinomonadaceae bacterium]
MRSRKFITALFSITLLAAPVLTLAQSKDTTEKPEGTGAPPRYQIVDIGFVGQTDTASQGLGVSPTGTGLGRSIRTGGSQAFTWTTATGITGLTNLSGRAYCLSSGANESGFAAGTCSTSLTGTSRLPVMWMNGVPAQLPLPAGQTLGDANDVNASGIAVGSMNSGSLQRGVIYSNGTATQITQTTAGGSFFVTAFKINDTGRVIGQGIDPSNAARNVGMVFDIGSANAIEVGALPNANGALAFDVSNSGYVVGSSMQNQGSGLPYRWSQAEGMIAIPLPVGTTQGSGRGVNSAGWVVGNASSATSIPFVYDGTNTYRLGDLLPTNSGWDLLNNTSSSALGISDGGVIVGTGVRNGQIRAYAMVPVASLAGRVVTGGGMPVRNARVTVSGGNLPAPLVGYTSGFGYFRFDTLQAGVQYTVSVQAGKYTFNQPSQTVTLSGDIEDLNFIADSH